MGLLINYDKKATERWERKESSRYDYWESNPYGMWGSGSVEPIENPIFHHRTGRIEGIWKSKMKLDKRDRYTLINVDDDKKIKVSITGLNCFWVKIEKT